MGKLDAAERKAIPADKFAGPDRSFPVENASHARNALARASEMLNKGSISEAEHAKIVAKANKVLGK
jgi:hypothetical protein